MRRTFTRRAAQARLIKRRTGQSKTRITIGIRPARKKCAPSSKMLKTIWKQPEKIHRIYFFRAIDKGPWRLKSSRRQVKHGLHFLFLFHCDFDNHFVELPGRNHRHVRIFGEKDHKKSTFNRKPGIWIICEKLNVRFFIIFSSWVFT